MSDKTCPDVGSTARAPAASRPATGRSPSVAAAGTDLTLTGNKTIAVDFGSSQDAFLRQSLDLAVSGTLAPGVELTGALSDRNTPLGAAGATQDLQSLDRVLIELKAPRGSAALGDVALDLRRDVLDLELVDGALWLTVAKGSPVRLAAHLLGLSPEAARTLRIRKTAVVLG